MTRKATNQGPKSLTDLLQIGGTAKRKPAKKAAVKKPVAKKAAAPKARATPAPKKASPYPFTAEDIVKARAEGLTWAQVAERLGVATTYCRGAYRALTGQAPSTLTAGTGTKRAPRASKPSDGGSGGAAVPRRKPGVDRNPHWNADSDQDELIRVLEPVWEIGSKGMKELKDAAWIRVHRVCSGAGNYILEDEFVVAHLLGFKFDKPEKNLLVEFHDAKSGGFRCIRVQDIVEVRR